MFMCCLGSRFQLVPGYARTCVPCDDDGVAITSDESCRSAMHTGCSSHFRWSGAVQMVQCRGMRSAEVQRALRRCNVGHRETAVVQGYQQVRGSKLLFELRRIESRHHCGCDGRWHLNDLWSSGRERSRSVVCRKRLVICQLKVTRQETLD